MEKLIKKVLTTEVLDIDLSHNEISVYTIKIEKKA